MLENKYKINPTPGRDINLKIALSPDNSLSGLQNDIEDFVEIETGLSINSADDGETFRYLPTGATTIKYDFYSGGSYYSNLIAAGFSSEDIGYTRPILSSFYLLTLYNNRKITSQLKLNNGFFNGFNFVSNDVSTIYNVDSNNEFSNLYIKNEFINSLSGETTLYFTLSFFNGKTGKLHLFFNNDLSGNTTEERNYFNIILNPIDKTYVWDSNINAREISNSGYSQTYNNSIEKFQLQKPIFPNGNAVSGNTYITI